jgi:hypothetical protein
MAHYFYKWGEKRKAEENRGNKKVKRRHALFTALGVTVYDKFIHEISGSYMYHLFQTKYSA